MEKYNKLTVYIPADIVINADNETRHFCPYCGKEMERHHEWDEYDNKIIWYTCECEDWHKAKQIEREIERQRSLIPDIKFEGKEITIVNKVKS